MAKKRIVNIPMMSTFEPTPRKDNNPSSGLCPMPNDDLEGCKYPRNKRMQMANAVAKGETVNDPDIIMQTANGTQKTFGSGRPQYNFGDGDAGEWNDNDFEGGNLTGI